MAGTSKKRTGALGRNKKTSAKETKVNQQARKQMWAVILFAVGLLMFFLTVIQGEKLWLWIHNFLFGILGWSVYFLAPLIIYIAIIAALDKPLSAIKAKLWQVMVLIILISGAIQIFGVGLPEQGSFVESFLALYRAGMELRGGGVAGALFALPLLALTGATGAKIIILLAIFVCVMLITGSSLLSLYHSIKRPVEGIEEAYAEAVSTQKERLFGKKTRKAKPGKNQTSGSAQQNSGGAAKNDLPDMEVDFTAPLYPQATYAPAEQDETEIPPSLFQIEKPVEYISPTEFAPQQDFAAPSARTIHPLEEELRFGQSQQEDSEIGEMIEHFFQNEQETPLNRVPVPADPTARSVSGTVQGEKTGGTITPVYRKPSIDLLTVPKAASAEDITEELKSNAQTLVDTLKSFGVQTRITDICRGPAVTRYELQPSAGVKISKITGLSDDIALNLASAGIRIEAPIPNKAAVGIEVPNKIISTVSIREIIESAEFSKAESSLTVALGKDIAGKATLADLAKMPHMLIAGATGSGKSVCINAIIVSLLYKSSPEEVKLLMVDPKVVELGIYNGIPHLLVPVVTDPKKAAGALNWAVGEMLGRYKIFADNSVRDLSGYNRLARQDPALTPMPKIVIIIDELADLMMAAPGDVEDAICRLAQMARAAGMHLVIATQRPSVDVITGVIKANVPSRTAFAVSSQVDSRTILDSAGAEKLLGRGDMLFYPVGAAKPVRVQGCFVTDDEVEKVVEWVKQGDTADYDETILEKINNHVIAEKSGKLKSGKDTGGGFDDEDEMLPQAIECVVEMGQASTSSLQRRLKLGYARAARIMDQLEQKGMVGPSEGSKPRQVFISKERWMEMKLSGAEKMGFYQGEEQEQ